MTIHTINLSLSSQEWVQLEIIRSSLRIQSIDKLIESLVKERLQIISGIKYHGKV